MTRTPLLNVLDNVYTNGAYDIYYNAGGANRAEILVSNDTASISNVSVYVRGIILREWADYMLYAGSFATFIIPMYETTGSPYQNYGYNGGTIPAAGTPYDNDTSTAPLIYPGIGSHIHYLGGGSLALPGTANVCNMAAWSIEFWCFPPNFGTNAVWYQTQDGSGHYMNIYTNTAGHPTIGWVTPAGTNSVTFTGTAVANVWNLIAVGYNGGTLSCSVNGVASTAVTGMSTVNSAFAATSVGFYSNASGAHAIAIPAIRTAVFGADMYANMINNYGYNNAVFAAVTMYTFSLTPQQTGSISLGAGTQYPLPDILDVNVVPSGFSSVTVKVSYSNV